MKDYDEFSKETKIMILSEVARTGEPYDLVADKYRLSPMFIMSEDGSDKSIEYNGERITLEQFKTKYPYRRCVVIRRRRYETD